MQVIKLSSKPHGNLEKFKHDRINATHTYPTPDKSTVQASLICAHLSPTRITTVICKYGRKQMVTYNAIINEALAQGTQTHRAVPFLCGLRSR
ncbi:hypothetical protein CDAR_123491 [Caerostris darwini]|uniref:Uncharacterized protein n=1 Tax=Caerostris darwini TaxID=1538125 RepID=A0AAV4WWN7_9ARAC|nr:hypothetical protein CDAR_123491 [Caerostris darwini]